MRMTLSMQRVLFGLLAALLSTVLFAAGLDQPRGFSIQPQPIASALIEFSKQANIQVITASEELVERSTRGVTGNLSIKSALEVLLEGTGLRFRVVNDNTVAVGDEKASAVQLDSDTNSIRMAQVTNEQVQQAAASEASSSGRDSASDDSELHEVVVTGSHIRGIQNRTNPVITLDREQIDRSGYSTVNDLLRSLPQNFTSGDAQEDGFYSSNSNRTMNVEFASGVNLRGLGSASTLVLLNGHRMAPSAFGTVVDISAIPLSAVDRVEVMTEGSSAVYGSDAVGGVVNLIMKSDYRGADTSIRYGGVTDGSRREKMVAQTLGTSWSGGNAVGAVQFQDQGALRAQDRQFAATLPLPNDLLPDTRSYAFTLNGQQKLTESLEFYGDVLASKREFARASSVANQVSLSDGDNSTFNIASGLRYDFASRWSAEFNGLFSRQSSDKVGVTVQGASILRTVVTDNKYLEKGADLIVHGRLGATTAGDIGMAMGLSYRDEELQTLNSVTPPGLSTPIVGGRNVKAVFGEIYLPLVGAQNRRTGVEVLEFSLAARLDDYSEFGSTGNPRIGMRWSPWTPLSFRASYGKSFRAPSSVQEFTALPDRQQLYVYEFANPSGTGTVPLLIFNGSKPLTPERAETINLAVDYSPPAAPGLTLSLSYYDIDYIDRIITPPFDENALLKPEVYGALITSIASDAEAQAIVDAAEASGAIYNDYSSGGTGVTGVRYLYDDRQQNASVVRQSGFDFNSKFVRAFDTRTLSVQLNISYIEKIETAFTPNANAVDLVDTFANPVQWRGRLDANWSGSAGSLSAALNAVDRYTNNVAIGAPVPIGSWTTLDLNATWHAESYFSANAFKGVSLSLIALNALDRDPPFVSAPSLMTVNYDSANASPLGRFIALEVRKKW